MQCSGIFEVNCSKDIRVQGIIGPCASLEKVWSNGFFSGFLFLLGFLQCKFTCPWLCAERSFVLWHSCRPGNYKCMEDVWPGQSYNFMSNIWNCKEGQPRCYCSTTLKLSILLPIFDLVCQAYDFLSGQLPDIFFLEKMDGPLTY